jgi:hypothetical protein
MLPIRAETANDIFFRNNFNEGEREYITKELTSIYDEIKKTCGTVSNIERFYGHTPNEVYNYIRSHLIIHGYIMLDGIHKELRISWA